MFSNSTDESVQILAPTGRDGSLLCQFLEKSGLLCREFSTPAELCAALYEGGGLVVLTGETLTYESLPALCECLRGQPHWSAIPILVLTSGGSSTPTNADLLAALGEVGNVTQIERPVRPSTLLSAIQAGLRARRRQYDVRTFLHQERRAAQEREELLEREKAARQAAEDASRLKDEFLATVSHELRTPLMAILGWAHLLKTENLDTQMLARGVDTIERNARNQVQLINDLLDVSRIITGKLRLELSPVDPAHVLEAALNVVRPIAEAKKIALEVALESVGAIFADEERLQQVVSNLLTNAIKFTPQHGTVRVQLRRETQNIEIQVQDTGKGIATEFLPHVFDQFRQADQSSTRAYGGLGLGLSIVRQIVDLHGGTVHAHSDGDGKGATFVVSLPIIAPVTATQTAPSHETNHAVRPLQNVRLLVVDDEKDILDLLSAIFERAGATVQIAASANEAFELLQTSPPDVLISDLGMPDEDGFSLIKRVRALNAAKGGQIPALALTAYVRGEDRSRALNHGFHRHMSKPIQPQELVNAVCDLVRKN